MAVHNEPSPDRLEGSVDIDIDDLLAVIKNDRRRHVIDIVATVGSDGIRVSEVADEVTSRECGKPTEQITGKERKRVYCPLKQLHLEKIEEIGLIEMTDRGMLLFPTEKTQAAADLIHQLERVTGGVA